MDNSRSKRWPAAAEVRYDPANWEKSSDAKPFSDETTNDLADWTGGFAPPPVEWNDRPRFSPTEMIDLVRPWRDAVKTETDGSAAGGHFSTAQADLLGQNLPRTELQNIICPPEWAYEDISGVPVMECWKQNQAWLRQHDPDSVLDGSSQVKPFWERFTGVQREMVRPPEVPDDKCDPEDAVSAQNRDQTANAFAYQKMENKQKKRLKRAELQKFRAEQKISPGVVTEHTPEVNMYIRPVEERDLAQLTEIMNYNITNTVNVPEVRRLTSNMMDERRLDVQDGLLPFLVAIERSAKGARRQGVVNIDPRQELVIGMVFADDYSDRSNMFRYTVEVECYVRKEYMQKKVGSALMDKILGILDPHYAAFGGYDYVGEAEGDKRVVKNILASVHLESADREKLMWCGEWLNRMGFEKKGELAGNGRKLGKVVDTLLYWKVTGSHITSNPL